MVGGVPLPGDLEKSCVHLGVLSEKGLELVEVDAVVFLQGFRLGVLLCLLDGLANCLVELLLAQPLVGITHQDGVLIHLAALLDKLHCVGIVTIKDYLHSVSLASVLADVEADAVLYGCHILCTCHYYELVTSELAQDGVCYFLITCHCFVAVFIVLPPLFNLLLFYFSIAKIL